MLLPTLLHGLVLIMSPLGLIFLPGEKRRDMAFRLEHYEALTPEEQPGLRREVATWLTRGQIVTWAFGLLVGAFALGRILALVALLFGAGFLGIEGSFAGLVGAAARAGIATAAMVL